MRAPSGSTVNRCGMSRGAERVLAAAELDGLVADLDRHGPVEDVEALVLAVVHVQRGLQARGRGDLEQGVHAAGLGG